MPQDVPACDLGEELYASVRRSLDATVLTSLRQRYQTRPLVVSELFLARYTAVAERADADASADASAWVNVDTGADDPADATAGATADATADAGTDATASIGGAGVHGPRQAGLGMHRDGTLLNCVVLLNHPSEFEGGGTSFAPPLDRIYPLGRGDCLCSCGQMLHGAADVTAGKRYVMVAFIEEEFACAPRSVAEGRALALAAAERLEAEQADSDQEAEASENESDKL